MLCGDTHFKVNESSILSKYCVLCANSRRDSGKTMLSKSVFAVPIGFTGIGADGTVCSSIYVGCVDRDSGRSWCHVRGRREERSRL